MAGERLQHWRGYVVEDHGDTFLARFEEVVGEVGDVEAEVYRHAVAEEDRADLQPGTYLEWIITADGMADLRIPEYGKRAWTAEDAAWVEAEAERMRAVLGLPDLGEILAH